MTFNLLLVGLGTGIGATMRYLLTNMVNKRMNDAKFPYATLFINLLACLLIGFAMNYPSNVVKLLIISGFLGGLSTYSTFANEVVLLFKGKQTKKLAMIYLITSLIGGLLLFWIGTKL